MDNKHTLFPARMSDGRIFTDYRPKCEQQKAFREPSYVSAIQRGTKQHPITPFLTVGSCKTRFQTLPFTDSQ